MCTTDAGLSIIHVPGTLFELVLLVMHQSLTILMEGTIKGNLHEVLESILGALQTHLRTSYTCWSQPLDFYVGAASEKKDYAIGMEEITRYNTA